MPSARPIEVAVCLPVEATICPARSPSDRRTRPLFASQAEAAVCSLSRVRRPPARLAKADVCPLIEAIVRSPSRVRRPPAHLTEADVRTPVAAAIRQPTEVTVCLPADASVHPPAWPGQRGGGVGTEPLPVRTPPCSRCRGPPYTMQMQMHYSLEIVYCTRMKAYTVYDRTVYFALARQHVTVSRRPLLRDDGSTSTVHETRTLLLLSFC
jgi:hypothetical protein